MDHVVVGVSHPGAAAAEGAVGLGAVHQVLLTQGYQLTRLLEYLSLNGPRGAEGPTGATVTLQTRRVSGPKGGASVTPWRPGPYLVFHLGDVTLLPVVDDRAVELFSVDAELFGRDRLSSLRNLGVDHGALQNLELFSSLNTKETFQGTRLTQSGVDLVITNRKQPQKRNVPLTHHQTGSPRK